MQVKDLTATLGAMKMPVLAPPPSLQPVTGSMQATGNNISKSSVNSQNLDSTSWSIRPPSSSSSSRTSQNGGSNSAVFQKTPTPGIGSFSSGLQPSAKVSAGNTGWSSGLTPTNQQPSGMSAGWSSGLTSTNQQPSGISAACTGWSSGLTSSTNQQPFGISAASTGWSSSSAGAQKGSWQSPTLHSNLSAQATGMANSNWPMAASSNMASNMASVLQQSSLSSHSNKTNSAALSQNDIDDLLG